MEGQLEDLKEAFAHFTEVKMMALSKIGEKRYTDGSSRRIFTHLMILRFTLSPFSQSPRTLSALRERRRRLEILKRQVNCS